MSNKEKISYLRRNSKWFLKMLAVQVVVIGQENWTDLPNLVHDQNKLPFLAGLTHKDYVDGINLWPAISDPETLLQFVVMTEGFHGGINRIRDIVANSMGVTLPVSRHKASSEEIKNIQAQRDQKSAVALYLSGNRKLTSPLKPGVQVMMKSQDSLFPFVNLSDTKPIFPSGSLLGQNISELLKRTVLKREQSKEYLYLMKPITKEDLEEMKEEKKGRAGRQEVMSKLEVIRSYGVLKTALEVASLGISTVNPLVNNLDNIPLLRRAQSTLIEERKQLEWLSERGFINDNEISLLLYLRIPSSNEK